MKKYSRVLIITCFLLLLQVFVPVQTSYGKDVIVRDPEVPVDPVHAPRYKGQAMRVGDEVKTNGTLWSCTEYDNAKRIAIAYSRNYTFGKSYRVKMTTADNAPCSTLPVGTFVIVARFESVQGFDKLNLPILQTIIEIKLDDGSHHFTNVLNKVLPQTFWG